MKLVNHLRTAVRCLVEDALRPISGPLGIRLRRIYYSHALGSCGSDLRIGIGVVIQNPQKIHLGSHVWIDRDVTLIAGIAGIPENTKTVDLAEQGNTVAVAPIPIAVAPIPIAVAPIPIAVAPGHIRIGNHSHVGIRAVIQGHGGIEIGDHFTCSTNASLYSLSNDPRRCRKGTNGPSHHDIFYLQTPLRIGNNVWLGLNVSVIGGQISDDTFVRPHSFVTGTHSPNVILGGTPAKKVSNRFSEHPVDKKSVHAASLGEDNLRIKPGPASS